MAFILGVLVWAVAAMMVVFMAADRYGAPEAASTAAPVIDSQYMLTLAITGVAFILAQALLGLFIVKYRDRSGSSVRYVHGNNAVELGAMALTAVVFVALAIMGQKTWASVHLAEPPADIMRVEVLGQQFLWNVRYPGPDGRFGETRPELYDDQTNPVGIDPQDPAGRDDIVLANQVFVPVNRPVELVLRSKDVIHDFFMPRMRLKQDTVPGLSIPLRFTATETGDYPVLCAELCGLGHYRMKATLHVLEPQAYEAWLREQAGQ